MVCLFRGAPVADAVRTNKCFAVSVLAATDAAIADDFAGQAQIDTRYRFGNGSAHIRTGSPARTSAAAVFDCHAEHLIVVGTHLLTVGYVASARST